MSSLSWVGCFSSVNVKIHRLNILFSTVALVAHPFIFYNRLNLLDCLQQNPIRNTFLRLFCHVEFYISMSVVNLIAFMVGHSTWSTNADFFPTLKTYWNWNSWNATLDATNCSSGIRFTKIIIIEFSLEMNKMCSLYYCFRDQSK